jgi:hypothetical protein
MELMNKSFLAQLAFVVGLALGLCTVSIAQQTATDHEAEQSVRLEVNDYKKTQESLSVNLAIRNIGTEPVYVAIDPLDVQGNSGPYAWYCGNNKQSLCIASMVFPPLFPTPYSSAAGVRLVRLAPRESTTMSLRVKQGTSESSPPVRTLPADFYLAKPDLSDDFAGKTISLELVSKVQIQLGVFDDIAAIERLLDGQSKGYRVNGNESLRLMSGKPTRLRNIQLIAVSHLTL